MPLAKKFVARYLKYSQVPVEPEDMVNAGCIGVIEGVKRFDPDRGFKFSTYAAWWIRNALQVTQKNETKIFRPKNFGMPYKLWRKAEAIEAQFGREPTAEELGVLEKDLEEWNVHISFVPLDADIWTDNNLNRSGRTLSGDNQVSNFIPDPEPNAEEQLQTHGLQKLLREKVNSLTPREHRVIRHLFFEDYSVEETAEKMGLSPEYVVAIRNAVIVRLRGELHEAATGE